MTRRKVLLAPLLAAPDTPRNRLCARANEFEAAWSAWADCMNAMRPGTFAAREPELFEKAAALFRKAEGLRREWLKGEV